MRRRREMVTERIVIVNEIRSNVTSLPRISVPANVGLAIVDGMRARLLSDIQNTISDIERDLAFLDQHSLDLRPSSVRLPSVKQLRIQHLPPIRHPRVRRRKKSDKPSLGVFHYGPEMEEIYIRSKDPECIDHGSNHEHLQEFTTSPLSFSTAVQREQSASTFHRATISVTSARTAEKLSSSPQAIAKKNTGNSSAYFFSDFGNESDDDNDYLPIDPTSFTLLNEEKESSFTSQRAPLVSTALEDIMARRSTNEERPPSIPIPLMSPDFHDDRLSMSRSTTPERRRSLPSVNLDDLLDATQLEDSSIITVSSNDDYRSTDSRQSLDERELSSSSVEPGMCRERPIQSDSSSHSTEELHKVISIGRESTQSRVDYQPKSFQPSDGRPKVFHQSLKWNVPSKIGAYSFENFHYRPHRSGSKVTIYNRTPRWTQTSKLKNIIWGNFNYRRSKPQRQVDEKEQYWSDIDLRQWQNSRAPHRSTIISTKVFGTEFKSLGGDASISLDLLRARCLQRGELSTGSAASQRGNLVAMSM